MNAVARRLAWARLLLKAWRYDMLSIRQVVYHYRQADFSRRDA